MDVYVHDTYVNVGGVQVWPPSWLLIWTGVIAAALVIAAVIVIAAQRRT